MFSYILLQGLSSRRTVDRTRAFSQDLPQVNTNHLAFIGGLKTRKFGSKVSLYKTFCNWV